MDSRLLLPSIPSPSQRNPAGCGNHCMKPTLLNFVSKAHQPSRPLWIHAHTFYPNHTEILSSGIHSTSFRSPLTCCTLCLEGPTPSLALAES